MSRDGFTSLEVLAATLLASALMVTVLGVLAGIARKEAAITDSDILPSWHEQLSRQLERDLQSAEQFRREPGKLILVGHGGSSGLAGQPTWLPTEIHYYRVELKTGALLLRQEVPAVGFGAASAPEILVHGATDIDLLAVGGTDEMTDTVNLPLLDAGSVPPRLGVIVYHVAKEKTLDVLFHKSMILF